MTQERNLPPNRLSVDKDSPYFDEYCIFAIGEVRINGVKVDCVEYDQIEGWARCYKRDENNRLIVENDELVTETIKGVVSVKWKDDK